MSIVLFVIIVFALILLLAKILGGSHKGTDNISEEQLVLMREMYESLTKEQRFSIYNIYDSLSQCCHGNVLKLSQVLKQMRLQAKVLDVNPKEADLYFQKTGAVALMNNLRQIKDRALLDSILISSYGIASMASGKVNGMDSRYVAQELLIKQFGQLGYTEKDIDDTIMKMGALMKQLG
ncbi:MAG: hypothetical protein IJ887_12840 [Prevotella sp.]|nr:hypothetical protein [Prevotella sp.]